MSPCRLPAAGVLLHLGARGTSQRVMSPFQPLRSAFPVKHGIKSIKLHSFFWSDRAEDSRSAVGVL